MPLDYFWQMDKIKGFLKFLSLGLTIGILAVYFSIQSPTTAVTSENLPPLKVHPLPVTLAEWQDLNHSGDYFDRVEVQDVGYLLWWRFPIRVYVEDSQNNPRSGVVEPYHRSRDWVKTVLDAVWEWDAYLPLEVVDNSEVADIKIFNKQPPLEPGNLRARSAETRYQLYRDENGVLSHRFTIWLSPTQVGKYIPAAARHEFGHALGIWGHSPVSNDVMYFSQVAEPPPISTRDINTLKHIYLQPTRLGW